MKKKPYHVPRGTSRWLYPFRVSDVDTPTNLKSLDELMEHIIRNLVIYGELAVYIPGRKP